MFPGGSFDFPEKKLRCFGRPSDRPRISGFRFVPAIHNTLFPVDDREQEHRNGRNERQAPEGLRAILRAMTEAEPKRGLPPIVWIGFAISAAFLAYFFRGVDWSELGRVLARA